MADDTNPQGTGPGDAAATGADAMRDAAQRTGEAMNAAGERMRGAFADHVMDPARRAGEAMRASGQKAADNSAEIGLKIIEQAERNSHEAFEAMRAAAKASDVSDVLRIQGDYLRQQGQRAMEQAREIGEMILRFGRDAVTPPKRD